MRIKAAKWVGALVVLAATSLAVGQAPPEPKGTEKKPADAKKEPAKDSLDSTLAEVLRNNPDIRVAEAKVHEAQAELDRVRLQTLQKVAAVRAAIAAQERAVAAAQERWEHAKRLFEEATSSVQELANARSNLEAAKAELERLQLELSALKGEVRGAASPQARAVEAGIMFLARQQAAHTHCPGVQKNMLNCTACHADPFHYSGNDPNLSHTHMAALALLAASRQGTAAAQAKPGSMTERILKALDTPVKLEAVRQVPVKDVLELLKEKGAKEIPFRLLLESLGPHTQLWVDPKKPPEKPLPLGERPINLMPGELPLGAWLLAIQDTYPEMRIVLREYGLLFTTTNRVPDGGLLLQQAWPRREAANTPAAKPDEAGEKK